MFLTKSQTIIQNSFYRLTSAITPSKICKHFLATADKPEQNPFNFTDEESDRILNLMNSKSMDNLAKYEISKPKLLKVEAWKLKHGKFENITDILTVESFSLKIAEKFYKSLLGGEPAKKSTRKAAPFVIPTLPQTQSAQINSCVSINIGVSSIAWSRLELRLDGPCELTHWTRHDLDEKKLHLRDLVDRCLYVNHLVPQADCYVFENPQVAQSSAPGNAEQVNINVQRAQLLAILGYALASRNTSKDRSQPNVFYMKRFLAAKLFQQLVGTERVSAEKAILNLMRTYYNVEDMMEDEGEKIAEPETDFFSSRGNVYFSSELRAMYKEVEKYSREFLGQALLLNLAFVRLVLLKDPKSLAQVGRNS